MASPCCGCNEGTKHGEQRDDDWERRIGEKEESGSRVKTIWVGRGRATLRSKRRLPSLRSTSWTRREKTARAAPAPYLMEDRRRFGSKICHFVGQFEVLEGGAPSPP